MARVVISDASHGRLTVEKREGQALLYTECLSFRQDKHFKTTSGRMRIPKVDLLRFVDEYRNGIATEFEIIPPSQVCDFLLRGIRQDAKSGSRFPTFFDALSVRDYPIAEPRISWSNAKACCAVDVDFHETDAPNEIALLNFATTLEPRPVYYWRTKRGGLRLIYLPLKNYSADELGACAALAITVRFPTCNLELKTDTRHPLYAVDGKLCSDVYQCVPTANVTAFITSSATVDVDDGDASIAVQAFYAERGLTVGERYGHEKCPIDPSPRSSGNVNPVVVFADHIHCYSCAAAGVTHRSRTPGYFSIAALTASHEVTQLRNCVNKMTHWGHAKYVAEPLFRDKRIASVVYRALLRQRHGDDPRIAQAESAAPSIIRKERCWGTDRGEEIQTSTFKDVLTSLPAAQFLDSDGEIGVSKSTVAMLMQPIDLTEFGYATIVPIHGMRVWGQFLETPQNRISLVTLPLRLRGEQATTPRYVSATKRKTIADAWARIETVFPGINRDVVRLLIAARGCSEGQIGVAPMVFMTGATGAGKTTLVQVAAAMLGDEAVSIPYNSNSERVYASVLTGKDRGSFALFDEWLKGCKKERNGPGPVGAMELLLSLSPDTQFHKLYVGPVPLGALPVCVWADTTIPTELEQHAQIARRLTHVHLDGAHREWEQTLATTGVHKPENLRASGGREINDACNAIVSDVIDEFFQSPITFAEIANRLGFAQLENSDLARETDDEIREFFNAVCGMPYGASETEAKRWPESGGWKVINLDSSHGVAELWKSLADAGSEKTSQRIHEIDLQRVLGLRESCKLETRQHGRRLAVRFRNAKSGATNDQLAIRG